MRSAFSRISMFVASTIALACGPMSEDPVYDPAPPKVLPPESTLPPPASFTGRVVVVSITRQQGRVDAVCPANAVLVGGGCSCNESQSYPPELLHAYPVASDIADLGKIDAYSCGCLPQPDGRHLGTNARAICLEGAVYAPPIDVE